MLNKKYKVPRSSLLILKDFNKSQGSHFLVRHKQNGLGFNRYLVVISGGLLVPVLERTEFKSTLYEIATKILTDPTGYDYVIYPRFYQKIKKKSDIAAILHAHNAIIK